MWTSTQSPAMCTNFGLRLGFLVAAIVTVSTATVTSASAGDIPCSRLETYNVGLMSGVDESHKRVYTIMEALKSSTSDFICMQEAWMEKYLSVIIDGVKPVFPHHFSPIHESKDVLRDPSAEGWLPLKDTACNLCESISVYSGLVSCAMFNGCFSKASSVSGAACVTNSCHQFLKDSGISEYCLSCVFINSARHVSEGIKQCALPQSTHNRMNGPGLLVLSRHDMANVTFTNLFPKNRIVIHRGYITAQLQSGITAVCTHFSPNLDHHGYVEYDTGFGSYKNQQAIEIQLVMKALKDSDSVLLGDFNTGPNVEQNNVEGDLPENFDLLMKGGYRSPFVEEDGRCTFCHENPLVKDSPNCLIDHIVLKKESSLTTSHIKRLYDKSNPPLSDHYGVGLQVCKGATGNNREEVCEPGSQDCLD